MLRAANLNVQFEGDSGGKVVSQSVAANSSAAYGTIVTLTMDSSGTTDTGTEAVSEETASSSDAASSQDTASSDSQAGE